MPNPDAKAIDALLPQTQCGECSYPGCMPYAEALAAGHATIDRCPPGGTDTLVALGKLLNIDPAPYDAEVKANTRTPKLAVIREDECIGCLKCIPACPVDAIIGTSKQLHQVLDHECTGCGLCVEPCPVDCIDLIEEPREAYDRDIARARFHAKKIRLLQEDQAKERRYRDKRRLAQNMNDPEQHDKTAKQTYILEAMQRARTKKK
jgi:Na+-translocating ferredoxin:NAD+ oxidoreductase subunit B